MQVGDDSPVPNLPIDKIMFASTLDSKAHSARKEGLSKK
jgi:hypothetical protein